MLNKLAKFFLIIFFIIFSFSFTGNFDFYQFDNFNKSYAAEEYDNGKSNLDQVAGVLDSIQNIFNKIKNKFSFLKSKNSVNNTKRIKNNYINSQNARAAELFAGNWQPLPLRTEAQKTAGMPGGEGMQMIFSIEYAQSNPNTLYLVSDTSQVWKSIDAGYSWQPKHNGFRSYGGVSLAVDPINENIVFVSGSLQSVSNATGTSFVDGIYRTLDGGETWQLVKQTAYYRGKEGRHFIFDLKSAVNDRHQTIYAATHSEGLLKSTDGGDTWNAFGLDGLRVSDIEINSNTPGVNILYAATNNTAISSKGLYKIIDDKINPPVISPLGNLPDYPRTIALAAKANPENDIIYAAVGLQKIYKSINGGNSFASKSNGLTVNNKEYQNIVVSPANPNYLYTGVFQTGVLNPFYSHNGGETWQKPATLDEGNLAITGGFTYHTPVLAPHPTNPNIAIGGIGSTIEKTSNGGASWKYSGNGYMGARVATNKSWYFNPSNPNERILFLVDFGPVITEDGGDTWRLLPVPNIGGKTAYTGDVDPKNPNVIITTAGNRENLTIIRSTDKGQTWQAIANTKDDYLFISFHPQDSNYLYAGTETGSRISRDNGQTWTFIPGKSIRAVSPDNGDIVYAFEPGINNTSILWRSINKGANWDQIASNSFNFSGIRDVIMKKGYPARLYAAVSKGLYVFDGINWTEIGKANGILSDPAYGNFDFRSVAVDPNNPGVIYAGLWAPGKGHRKSFVFRSVNDGASWEDIGGNLGEYATVGSLAVNPLTSEVYLSVDQGNYTLDTNPPVISNIKASNITANSAIISWLTNKPALSQVKYGLDTNYGSSSADFVNFTTSHFSALTGLNSNTLYHYKVISKDRAGNSGVSQDMTLKTLLFTNDGSAPTVPLNLKTKVVSSTQINLSWSPSIDNIGVAGYKIYRSGIQIASSSAAYYSDTGLTPATIYKYAVSAYDAVDNVSNLSLAVSAKTLSMPDTTVNFDNPLPVGTSGSFLNGVYQDIDFGINQWRWKKYGMVNGNNNIYFNSDLNKPRTIVFYSGPKILKSMKVSTLTPAWITLTDDNGQRKTEQLIGDGYVQTIMTNWTKVSKTVTITFSQAWNPEIDDIIYND